MKLSIVLRKTNYYSNITSKQYYSCTHYVLSNNEVMDLIQPLPSLHSMKGQNSNAVDLSYSGHRAHGICVTIWETFKPNFPISNLHAIASSLCLS